MALAALEELEIELQGEVLGWFNATCTYYDLAGSVRSKPDMHYEG